MGKKVYTPPEHRDEIMRIQKEMQEYRAKIKKLRESIKKLKDSKQEMPVSFIVDFD